MRTTDSKCSDAGDSEAPQAAATTAAHPSIEDLRAAIDARLRELGRGRRTTELRRVGMSNTTFERLLREGLSSNPRAETAKRLRRMGVLDLIPRRKEHT